MELKWENKKPIAPGMYLRNNPPISAITKEWIEDLDGQLNLITTGSGMRKLKDVSDRFWWYGPIPKLPY